MKLQERQVLQKLLFHSAFAAFMIRMEGVPSVARLIENFVKIVHVAFIGIVVAVPDLREERVCLRNGVIIPRLDWNVAVRAPVSTEQDECRTCEERFSTMAAFPFNFCGHITFLHRFTGHFTTSEFRRLDEVIEIDLI